MNQGIKLGSQMGRFIILAALVVALGALLLTIRPVVAQQTDGCGRVGTIVTCYFTELTELNELARTDALEVGQLRARDFDVTEFKAVIWELVTDGDDPALGDPADLMTDFPDYRLFEMDRISGALSFKSPPDYEDSKAAAAETSTSLAGENVYKVMAKVGDGKLFRAVEITVHVRGKEEDGTITLSNRQPQVGVPLTATLDDPDTGHRTPDWQWQVETGEGTGVFEDIEEEVDITYTPVAGDAGKKLRASARYEDAHFTDQGDGTDYVEVLAVSEFPVRDTPSSNDDPEFHEDDEDTDNSVIPLLTSRRIEENAETGAKVGPAFLATDDDHLAVDDPDDPGGPRDVLTYSLRDAGGTGNDPAVDDDDDILTPAASDGHAAKFSIDQATGRTGPGQIRTKGFLNRSFLDCESLSCSTDTPSRYQILVRATDPSGEFGDVTVNIHVVDEDEAPEITGPAALTYLENSATADGDPELRLDRDHDTADVEPSVYMAIDNDLDDETELNDDLRHIQWQLTGPDASKFRFAPATNPISIYTNSASIAVFVAATTGTPAIPAMASAPALQFRSAPRVEDEADVGGTPGDNVFEITVVAWDRDWERGRRDVTISLEGTNDEGTVTLSHIQPQVGTEITASVDDPDRVKPGTIEWKWYTGTSANADVASGTLISGATSATFTPTGDENGDFLIAEASYQDGTGNQEVAEATSVNAVRTNPITDATGENTDPKFYTDAAAGADNVIAESEATTANETSSYTRYVLEGQVRNVRNRETADPDEDDGARGYIDSTANDAAAAVKVWDGFFASETDKNADPPDFTEDGTNGRSHLQYDLSGAGAENFAINRNPGDTDDPAGLIRTKRALDFETQSTYRLKVKATDPAGASTEIDVTIHVLDVPEIHSVGTRIRIDENTKEITDLSASYPSDRALGGLKWSLLTANEPSPNTQFGAVAHNRTDVFSVDCQYIPDADPVRENLCDDFRLERQNTADTTLRFAIGDDNAAPDYENQSDEDGIDAAIPTGTDINRQAMGDNVYQIMVRVAFANLRSSDDDNHPNPQTDEMDQQLFLVRVDDVDEEPTFGFADSSQSVDEDSKDVPIDLNRDLSGSVSATDPEDTGATYAAAEDKKLTFSFSLPEAYAKMFHIVPSTGEILTRSYVNYEDLSELDELGASNAQYRRIDGGTITVSDSYGAKAPSRMMDPHTDTIDVDIDVHDVNERVELAEPLVISGMAAVDYAEDMTDTTVGTYMVSGDNAAMAEWSPLGGADMGLFELDVDGQEAMLKFKAAPDYEMPGDADGDNMYMVTIEVMYEDDDGEMDMHSLPVTITVTNVEELGMLEGMSSDSVMEGMVDVGTYMVSGGTMADTATWSVEGADMGQFEVDGTGMSTMLKFSSAPDYEMPRGAAKSDTNTNTYMVTVKAEAGGEMAMMEVTVMVTGVDELGEISGPASPDDYTENSTDAVGTYAVTGGDGSTINWTLEGADASHFMLTEDTGMSTMLNFSSAPDYEMPRGAVMSETNTNTYMVTVKAEGGGEMEMVEVTVDVTNVDELGMLEGMESISYAENGTDAVGTYTTTGPDTATWSLDGADAEGFNISSGGSLAFKTSPDFEAPADADTNNTYMVIVKASAGGEMDTQDVTVTVTDEEELGTLSGPGSASHMENSTDAVATYTASGPMADTATWNVGGADANYFTVTDGMLRFSSAPDYEMPRDAEISDTNTNTYMVTVKASAGGEMAMQDVTVMVTDVGELGMLGGMESISYAENGTDAVGTYTTTGPDTATWSLDGADAEGFNISSGGSLAFKASPDFEAPADADTNNTYMVTVKASAGGEMEMMDVTVTVTDVSELGMLGGMESISYAENGTDAVGTYTTTGPDTATWSLDGADAEGFNISSGGSLAFKTSPDFEAPADADTNNTYMVTVKASAGGEMEMMDVTVTVTNVDELGTLSGPGSASHMENSTDAVATYTVSGGDGSTINWSLDGADASQFMLDGTGMARMLKFKSAPDYEMPRGAAMSDTNTNTNTYMVTVKAEAGGVMEMVEVTVTVTDVSELGMLEGMESISYAENGTDAVGTYTVSGGDGSTVNWSLDGADSSQFTLEGTGMSRMLKFSSAPDYEMPADADGDNEYMVTVKAEAGGEMKMVEATVTVTDVDEEVPVDLVDGYDTNGVAGIQIDELFSAIDDYFAGGINISELFEVIDAYFLG